MPSIDGKQFTRQLRTFPEGMELPVILMTNLGHVAIAPEEGSFSGVLTKPIKAHQLLHILNKIFSRERPADTVVAAKAPVVTSVLAKARILMVEDNLTNQRVQVALLNHLSVNPVVANDGVEALVELDQAPFDIVLMDLQMPNMDGFTATREIRSRYPADRQPVIIAMTANALPQDRAAAADAGMDDYLTKPVKIAQLQGRLEHWLKLRSERPKGIEGVA
jgi:CheY-like chemotaxis protein